jgi:hypothetical protein
MKTANVVEGINSGIKWVQKDGIYSLMDDENTYVTIPRFDLLKLSYTIDGQVFELEKKKLWSARYKVLNRSGMAAYEFKQSPWSLKGDLTFHNGKQYQLKFENNPIFSLSVYAPGSSIPVMSYGQAVVGKVQTQHTVKTNAHAWNDIELLHIHAFAFWMFKKMLGSTDDDVLTMTLLLSAT